MAVHDHCSVQICRSNSPPRHYYVRHRSLGGYVRYCLMVRLLPLPRRSCAISGVCYSVCEQGYCKSNEPILLKLGAVIGPTSRKNYLTFCGALVKDTKYGSFLPRDAMRSADEAVVRRPSVRPSHAGIYRNG